MDRDPRLAVSIKRLRMRTPLMTASGTSGSRDEMEGLREGARVLDALGAFVTKGVTLDPRPGNPPTRVVETPSGLLNSIGLQNSGAAAFVHKELPRVLRYELPIIVNISADSVGQFGELAACLLENDVNHTIAGIEINVSCPNIKEGGVAFGIEPRLVERIVKGVKKRVHDRVVVITKLTPNVTDITQPANAAIAGGTDALSMINTLRGMAIDIEHKKPFFKNVHGGLSGPAIRPVGVFMVYECFGKIPECRDQRIPIIGIGGIAAWQDALEYIMAGATAVGIGTSWFVNTQVFSEVKKGLAKYLKAHETRVAELVGIGHGRGTPAV